MRKLEPWLGWAAFLGLCVFWWWVGRPETILKWVAVAIRVGLNFALLRAGYSYFGYRYPDDEDSTITPENLKALARERLVKLQSALNQGDLSGLRGLFSTKALNQLAALPASTVGALRVVCFGDDSLAEITGGERAATVTIVSEARRLGDPIIKAKLTITLDDNLPISEVNISPTTLEI